MACWNSPAPSKLAPDQDKIGFADVGTTPMLPTPKGQDGFLRYCARWQGAMSACAINGITPSGEARKKHQHALVALTWAVITGRHMSNTWQL
jgi:hypothetical protein